MINDTYNNELFCNYYAQWIEVYKRGAIRDATMAKYLMTQKWVEKLVPELKVSQLTRTVYQQLLNDYAKEHERQTLSISKTWDYKGEGGFLPTKNKSSIRKIQIDWQIVVKFSELTKNLPENEPIFAGNKKIYNSTVNDILTRHCRRCGISEISIHGLRHTHASLLLFAGVSIASVARRLGHASMTTTQKTYLHIIQELENKDVDLVMRTLSGL